MIKVRVRFIDRIAILQFFSKIYFYVMIVFVLFIVYTLKQENDNLKDQAIQKGYAEFVGTDKEFKWK